MEAAYSGLMRTLLDEAKEGPRVFSFEPVEPGFFDRPKWISAKFQAHLVVRTFARAGVATLRRSEEG